MKRRRLIARYVENTEAPRLTGGGQVLFAPARPTVRDEGIAVFGNADLKLHRIPRLRPDVMKRQRIAKAAAWKDPRSEHALGAHPSYDFSHRVVVETRASCDARCHTCLGKQRRQGLHSQPYREPAQPERGTERQPQPGRPASC